MIRKQVGWQMSQHGLQIILADVAMGHESFVILSRASFGSLVKFEDA